MKPSCINCGDTGYIETGNNDIPCASHVYLLPGTPSNLMYRVGTKEILYCVGCNVPLQMTNYRSIYCPKCKKSTLPDGPESILCCAECEKPLRVTDWVVPREIKGWPKSEEGYGSYCENCGFHPSMQDTFLWKIDKLPEKFK